MSSHYTVYDIETEPFSTEFNAAKTTENKIKFAPKPRVMVVYSSESKDFHSFENDDLISGVELILSSDIVVSYNGESFDESVLIRNGSLNKSFSEIGLKSVDLMVELCKLHGFRAKLDALARLNLDEKKHTSGRKMAEISGEELIKACKSDVSQTKRLYEKWLKDPKSISYPKQRQRNWVYADYADHSLEFSHLTQGCFECGSPHGEFFEEDISDMTDGQMAEYMAGTWGEWTCFDCGVSSFREA
jgi:hypothetical protein